MSIIIEIKKKNIINGVYYYSIRSNNKDRYLFYIGIDSKKKQIMFFDNDNFSSPIAIVDQERGVIKGDSNIYPGIAGRVLTKAYQAINDNDFPEDISWNS